MARDLILLGIGYVLVLSIFVRLGGFGGAGSAVRRWGTHESGRRRKRLSL